MVVAGQERVFFCFCAKVEVKRKARQGRGGEEERKKRRRNRKNRRLSDR